VQHVWVGDQNPSFSSLFLTSLQRSLDSKGLIYKGSHKGWYSVSDECYYTDNQIERLKTPPGAPNGPNGEIFVSKETGSVVEWTEEENYKFRLSRFRDSLLARYQSDPQAIYPLQQHANILDALSVPLEDLSVSRPRDRLHWGISVPDDPTHTVYVWFDALINYLTGIGYPWDTDEQKIRSSWPPDLQVVGKDIIRWVMSCVMYLDPISNFNRFHAIYFPAMLQALDLPLPKRILAHSHWTVNRRKMSKSIGNVVDPFQAMEVLGTDLVRYYLARIGGRFKDDVGESKCGSVTTLPELIASPDWSSEQLEKNAAELQSLLGNFYLRITSAAIRRRLPEDFHSQLRKPLEQSLNTECLKEVANHLQHLAPIVDHHLKELRVAEALEAIIHQLKAVCPAFFFTIGRLLTIFPPRPTL
jgi:methionyl-tRNA synthetase